MPGVQKPHCRPCSCLNAAWIGWSCPSWSSPSTVVTSRPSACTPNIVQDLIGRPSSSTVQAPQLVVSQPTCVPVSPNSSRIRCARSIRGSTSALRSAPLTLTVICIVPPSIPRPREPSRAPVASPRRTYTSTTWRLYSADPRTSVTGEEASAARRPASANAASVGSAPARLASASVGCRFFDPTAVRPMPARSIVPSDSERWTAAATVAKSPTLRSIFRYVPPDDPAGCGTRTSVRISSGSSAVVNVSSRNSVIGSSRSPRPLRSTTDACNASITEPQSPAGSA